MINGSIYKNMKHKQPSVLVTYNVNHLPYHCLYWIPHCDPHPLLEMPLPLPLHCHFPQFWPSSSLDLSLPQNPTIKIIKIVLLVHASLYSEKSFLSILMYFIKKSETFNQVTFTYIIITSNFNDQIFLIIYYTKSFLSRKKTKHSNV